jgi:hypothetical protein
VTAARPPTLDHIDTRTETETETETEYQETTQ